jgi:transposase
MEGAPNMMGHQDQKGSPLFYYNFTIESRVPQDHPLRQVEKVIDFGFIYKEVESLYGKNGNVSVPPPVILKLMFLLFCYDVPSERQLMEELPCRLDWLWFLGYDLDSQIPDHSVLSKARARWGQEAFKTFFSRVVFECIDADLLDGTKMFADSSVVAADVSDKSIVDRTEMKRHFNEKYQEIARRLEPVEERRYVSTTDPDAALVRKGRGRAKACYAEHRAVDSKAGVITASITTTGSVNEAHLLGNLLDEHQSNAGSKAEVAVADSKYGTVENFLELHDRGVRAHMPNLSELQKGSNRREGIFDISEFIYDETTETYTCPAGKQLRRMKHKKKQRAEEYSARKKTCRECALRDRCTRSKSARTVKRHHRQKELDQMLRISHSARAKRDLKTRKHLMERSFADAANNHGFKRSRWRGLERVSIQNLIIAAVQNIRILIAKGHKPAGVAQGAWERGSKWQYLTILLSNCRIRMGDLLLNFRERRFAVSIPYNFAFFININCATVGIQN